MDDMNAFERQVVGQIRTFVGPSRPVNDAAIFTAITATESPERRFGSLFSATRFVVAGAIVALFGGFLLAAVLTQASKEPVPAVGATTSADASQSPETAIDVRDLGWRPLELDDATFGPGAHLVDVAASDTMLVIGGSVDGSAAIWTSTDGLEWTLIPQDEAVFGGPGRHEIKAVAPWRDGFVAGGEVRGSGDFDPLTVAAVWLSEDGSTWTRVPHDEAVFGGVGRQQVFDVAASDDRILIAGFDEELPNTGDGDGGTMWISTDGLAWEQVPGTSYGPITTTPKGFVAGGSGVRTSSDGVTWELSATIGEEVEVEAMASTPHKLVALGGHDGDLAAWSSSDGVDWSQGKIDAPVPEPDREAEWQPSDVAAAASGFAAVVGPWDPGDDSAVIVSSDGETWVAGKTPASVADAGLSAITGFGSDFVALGGWTDDTTIDRPVIWTTIEIAPSEADVPSDETAATDDLLPGVDPSKHGRPLELPAEIPVGIDSGTLDTPAGPARWVHLTGDETSLPPQWAPMVQTPDGFVVAELGRTPARLWRSQDLLEWTSEPLGIEADYGDLWQSGAGYWLIPAPGDALWRSADTRTWERVPLEVLSPPSPYAGAWALSADPPVAYAGTELIPFTWYLPFPGQLEQYLDPDGEWPDDVEEVEPRVYEFTAVGVGGDERIRLEETDEGVRLLAAGNGEEATELGFFEGFTVDLLERAFTDGVEGIRGLLLLENGELVTVPAPGGDEGWWELAITADDEGFLSYSPGDDALVHVHRSQDGRDWIETDLIGDDPDEPNDAVSVHRWGRHVVIEDDRTWWIATDDGGWRTMGPTPDLWAQPLGDGWVQGPLESRVDGPPDTVWYQPRVGEPVRFDISAMDIPQEPCGGSESFISSNTVVTTSAGPDCDGRREVWILTFDDVPA